MSPLLTVIVPVYNVEKYLDKCLDTIVNQTYRNLQIILVDDKTPDSSGEICDNWAKKDSRIEVIHKSVNEGLSLARNDGMALAKGDYIAFVDSDDYLEQDIYERLITAAMRYNADITYMGVHRQNSDGSFTDVVIEGSDPEVRTDIDNIMIEHIPGYIPNDRLLSAWGAIYKREVCDHLFISERVSISEDLEWSLRSLAKSNVVCRIPYAGYFYKYTPNGISKKYGKEVADRVMRSVANILFVQDMLKRTDIVPYYAFYTMRMLQRMSFNSGSKDGVYAIVKSIVKNKEYRKMISDSSNLNINGFKDKLLYWSHKSGNALIAVIYAWIDKRVICDKLGLIKK